MPFGLLGVEVELALVACGAWEVGGRWPVVR